ncbi:hypothetical protein [Shewanella waksmanii]|uniref:hypothetical protein n=1 Tax=Shewanella waksmanii TaxID=213783 RepID=UPI0037367284
MFITLLSGGVNDVPTIITKRSPESNVIKRSQLAEYPDALTLVEGLKVDIDNYEIELRSRIESIVENKERELNQRLESILLEAENQAKKIESEWLRFAESKYREIVSKQKKEFSEIEKKLKKDILERLIDNLSDFQFDEKMINCLTENFNCLYDDAARHEDVQVSYRNGSTFLTVEDNNSVIELDTKSVVDNFVNCIKEYSEDQ